MKRQIAISLALTSLMTTVAGAGSFWDDYSRAGKWEASGFGQYLYNGNGGETLWGGGVGIGYNALDQLSINAHFSINWENGEPRPIYMGGLSLDFNILKKPLTPFLTAGAGAASVPGLDWSFGGYHEVRTTEFTLDLGAGLRWDVSDRLFVKATYGGMLIAGDDWLRGYQSFSLAIGFKF